MKILKSHYFESHHIDFLCKQPNASELLRRLLQEHIERTQNPYQELNKDDLDFEVKKLEILEEAYKKIEGAKHGTISR